MLIALVVCVVMVVVFSAVMMTTRRENVKMTRVRFEQKIPKIIHQIALEPRARPSTWPASWKQCHASWKRLHPDFEHRLWTDHDLDWFMRTEYPAHYSMYRSYDGYIKRADAARFFLLHRYGGIYADMDYECLKRFHEMLPEGKVSIVESPWEGSDQVYQNSLMASPPGHPFWSEVAIPMLAERAKGSCTDVIACTGPRLLRDAVQRASSMSINVLERDLYSGHDKNEVVTDDQRRTAYAVHYGTGTWFDRSST
jgi:mannosyltransferase OCH1-like enzyme